MATPDLYGVGISVLYDWPLRFTYSQGFTNLGNNLCRRLQTPRGSLPWDLNCGWDVRQLLRGTLSAASVNAAQSAIGAECEKDERVDSATAAITYIAQAKTMVITVTVTGADGPFTLVLSVTDLTVQILNIVVNP